MPRASARRWALWGAALAAVWALAAWAAGLQPAALVDHDGLRNALALLAGLAHPDLSADFVSRVLRLAVESLAIGVAGTGLALVAAIPLAYVATAVPDDPDAPQGTRARRTAARVFRSAARWVLAFFRSIPEIVWAYLFVRIVGLGPAPAVLAIAVTFGGILGKLYAELAEAVDPRPVVALRRAGCSRFAAFLHGVLPQVRAQWVRYGLFRLECGIRSASILGVVGAGGLGTEIDIALRYFQYDKLATALAAVLVLVAAFDFGTDRLLRLRRLPVPIAATGAVAALVGALAWLDVPWADLASRATATQLGDFAAGLAHPVLAPSFVGHALLGAGQTVAMAWTGTFAAAVVAFTVAPFVSRHLAFGSYLEDAWEGASRAGRWTRGALRWSARTVLQVTRALPELTWAMLAIVWVGPGATAGILALAAHNVGIIGRLFADVYDEVEPVAARSLEAAGATRTATWAWTVLPPAAPRLAAYALFRFEVNVRLTAMMGFVGAGGLGDAIHTAISLFQTRHLATLLLVLFATVIAVDAAGDRLRRRLLRVRS